MKYRLYQLACLNLTHFWFYESRLEGTPKFIEIWVISPAQSKSRQFLIPTFHVGWPVKQLRLSMDYLPWPEWISRVSDSHVSQRVITPAMKSVGDLSCPEWFSRIFNSYYSQREATPAMEEICGLYPLPLVNLTNFWFPRLPVQQ